jgi:predicted DNA-binding transcriptional regulator AlpA
LQSISPDDSRENIVDKSGGTSIGSIDLDALKDALKALLKDVVREALKEQRTPDKPFTRPELIAHLGFSKTTFDRIESRGEGPRKTRLSSRRICYLPGDVKAWQEARREKGAA